MVRMGVAPQGENRELHEAISTKRNRLRNVWKVIHSEIVHSTKQLHDRISERRLTTTRCRPSKTRSDSAAVSPITTPVPKKHTSNPPKRPPKIAKAHNPHPVCGIGLLRNFSVCSGPDRTIMIIRFELTTYPQLTKGCGQTPQPLCQVAVFVSTFGVLFGFNIYVAARGGQGSLA